MDFSILKLAASGVRAQQTRIDFVGQNLANLQTTGYRAIRPEIVDLPSNRTAYGDPTTMGLVNADDPTAGASDARDTRPDLAGPVTTTGAPLDVAMPRGIYLSVQLPGGQTGLTRDGHLGVAADGTLVVGPYQLATTIRVPAGSGEPLIDAAGNVHVVGPNGDQQLGALPLVRIPNPEQLQHLGEGVATPTIDSGAPQPVLPADLTGFAPGAVEGSNVQIDGELTHLMRAQRAYQANAQMIHTWDDLANQTIQEMGHA